MAYGQDEQTWLNKWRREGFTFPFGSLMSAYSQIKAGELVGKDTKFDLKQFEDDARTLFKLALEMTEATAIINETKLKATADPNQVEILED